MNVSPGTCCKELVAKSKYRASFIAWQHSPACETVHTIFFLLKNKVHVPTSHNRRRARAKIQQSCPVLDSLV
jgi:hypothetical protein